MERKVKCYERNKFTWYALFWFDDGVAQLPKGQTREIFWAKADNTCHGLVFNKYGIEPDSRIMMVGQTLARLLSPKAGLCDTDDGWVNKNLQASSWQAYKKGYYHTLGKFHIGKGEK